MKTILLAAGRSKRLKPVEDKNFLMFLGKPLIQHQLEMLIQNGFLDISIIGGAHNLEKLKKLAKNLLQKKKKGMHLQVLEQKNLDDGMAGAILSAEKFIKNNEDIFVISSNDLVEHKAFELLLKALKNKNCDSFLLGKKVESYFPGGYLKIDEKGLIKKIVEKPGAGNEPSDMVNVVLHYHRKSKKLFEVLHKIKSTRDDRYEATMDQLIQMGVKMKVVPYDGKWQPIKYPWDVLTVMDIFLDSTKNLSSKKLKNNVQIASTAVIRGNVILEDGVKILDHAVVIGPAYLGKNTIVATNALVRNSIIGDDCVIGFGTEIARSLLGNQVWTHTNYIGDSVIGNNCSFGSGTVTGNLRLDEADILVNIQGEKVNSKRTKFGMVTGDFLRCGINTSFMPGVKVGHHCFIGAGIIIAQDIPDKTLAYGKTELILKENKATLDNTKREKMRKGLK